MTARTEVWWQDFANSKISTTTVLVNECEGTYGDVILILTAVISSMSSECWPGRNIDRSRFIEVLIRNAPETKMISIPRFRAYLDSRGLHTEKDVISNRFMSQVISSRILIGPDVDKDEAEILPLLGDEITAKDIRKYSYASLLYSELRCGYSHNYMTGGQADCLKMTSSMNPCVSYVNYIDEPYRLIHFDLNWLAKVVKICAQAADQHANELPLEQPRLWWANGKT